jgi:hypothetical protein
MESDFSEVAEAVAKAFADIDGIVAKDGQMKFGDRFQYASDAAFIDAVRPAMAKHGVIVVADDHEYTITPVGETKGGSMQYLVTDKITWRIYASGCDASIRMCTVGQGVDTLDKAAVKAGTQAHKNALRQLFCLEVVSEDKAAKKLRDKRAPAAATEAIDTGEPKHHPSWPAGRSAFFGCLTHYGYTYDEVAAYCAAKGKPRPSQMPPDQRKALMNFLETDKAKQEVKHG